MCNRSQKHTGDAKIATCTVYVIVPNGITVALLSFTYSTILEKMWYMLKT